MLNDVVMHQKKAQALPPAKSRGEAPRVGWGGETTSTQQPHTDAGEPPRARRSGHLLSLALERGNMQLAWKRVKANKGGAGVDGLDIAQTKDYLKAHWAATRDRLERGTYQPQPVRRVSIPKPNGGVRELGIPTVVDRVIQQALLQVLQPMIDPTFSNCSYGFRPARSAHMAVRAAKSHVQAGAKVVVDVDLERFFDRVNHDILMSKLQKHIDDPAVLRLIRAYLNAGMMDGGVASKRVEGTPQGGPLSPLLANVMLDSVDKELEKRGHRFVRYADDCNIYVHSLRAGERVMQGLRACYAKLRLRVNEDKSAVAGCFGRKFLGYTLWQHKGEVKTGISKAALAKFKVQIRKRTRRSGGRSMAQVVEQLRPYLLGWRNYFGLAQAPSVWQRLDEWMRHRLRTIQLKQWRRGSTIYRELRALGASEDVARITAANSRRWWRNSTGAINRTLTIAYFDKLGLPRLCQ